jgi:uncharacterized protein DUF732
MKANAWVRTAAGFVVALGVGAITLPGAASATTDDYLYDLRSNGIGGPDNELLKLGNDACGEKAQKVSPQQSALNIKGNSNLDINDATFLYESATHLICPG